MLRKLYGLFLITLLLIPSTTAQDNTTNLLDMLATVPDTPTNRENPIAFVDLRAMELARPIASPPNSWDEYESLKGTIDDDRYFTAFVGIQFLTISFPGRYWHDFVGIDWFDIDRVIEYGMPTQEVTTLVGEFDIDPVTTTLSSRDYTLEPVVDFMLWCGRVGCDNGLQTTDEDVFEYAPFGGELGRQQPIYISSNMISSAPVLTNLYEIQETINDNHDTLADDPAYRAAINAVDPESILIQAGFFDTSSFVISDEIRAKSYIDDQIDIFNQADIPPYELILVADTVVTGMQVVHIIMVYDEDENIDQVADVVTNRLQTMRPLNIRGGAFDVLIEERGIFRVSTTTRIDESTGKALVILRALSPALSSLEAASGEVDKFGSYGSDVYWLFFNIMLNNDTLWIASEIAD